VLLKSLPLIFVLIGLVFYMALAGADFGAGIWQALAGGGEEGERRRDIAHQRDGAGLGGQPRSGSSSCSTVMWTAYPVALGSIASTLAAALLIAGVGIIVARCGLRAAQRHDHGRASSGASTAPSPPASVVAPFALGAAIGGIASGRVPVGNAAGHLISSWVNATSILTGALAVVFSAYLGAIYPQRGLGAPLRVRADRVVPHPCARHRRRRGALAIAGLVVLHEDEHRLYHGLVAGDGLPALIVSVLAGAGRSRWSPLAAMRPARYSAALAVAAVVAGWALAQQPQILPGLTVSQAAASHATLVAVVIAVLAGA